VTTAKETITAREAFAELYEEFLPKVFRHIQYKVSDIQLTEDLTSKTFEKALVNFNKYASDKAKFSTWIFTIARNVVIDHYRVQGRRGSVSLEEATDTLSNGFSPDEELVRKEELKKLQVSLSGLSQEEQEIISLKFGSEMNNRQIAKMLGLSESNVGTKLYRAVRKLRDSFQEPENG
jgi:RNA polymerase sigma-70 factor (ECF subfamily)